eukprot:SAG11_NODE_2303_length_3547_cov_7.916473_2_plen_59_part_00
MGEAMGSMAVGGTVGGADHAGGADHVAWAVGKAEADPWPGVTSQCLPYNKIGYFAIPY